MKESEESDFTVLENKTIGRNFFMFRKIRDCKAMEVAEFLGIKEATYTKYERGESKITVDLIQKVSEFLNVDPLQLISVQPGHLIEHLTNSPISINYNSGDYSRSIAARKSYREGPIGDLQERFIKEKDIQIDRLIEEITSLKKEKEELYSLIKSLSVKINPS
jgi:transcriptional regulator with XRE-family HTH domain